MEKNAYMHFVDESDFKEVRVVGIVAAIVAKSRSQFYFPQRLSLIHI